MRLQEDGKLNRKNKVIGEQAIGKINKKCQ